MSMVSSEISELYRGGRIFKPYELLPIARKALNDGYLNALVEESIGAVLDFTSTFDDIDSRSPGVLSSFIETRVLRAGTREIGRAGLVHLLPRSVVNIIAGDSSDVQPDGQISFTRWHSADRTIMLPLASYETSNKGSGCSSGDPNYRLTLVDEADKYLIGDNRSASFAQLSPVVHILNGESVSLKNPQPTAVQAFALMSIEPDYLNIFTNIWSPKIGIERQDR